MAASESNADGGAEHRVDAWSFGPWSIVAAGLLLGIPIAVALASVVHVGLGRPEPVVLVAAIGLLGTAGAFWIGYRAGR